MDYGIPPPGFRLPAATRVAAVRLQVSNLEESLDYYRHVLGLRVISASAEHVSLGPAGPDRPFLSLETSPGVTRARRGALGLYHFAILLPDREALGSFVDHLTSLGIRPGMADHLVSEALYLWDPDRLGIEVYADRPRTTWRHRERELVMTTDPLDLTALTEAARGQRWTGMPAATRIGHLHLHVGDLGEGERFYHRALGFDKMVWSYPGALFLAAGGYHHHLGTNIWSPGPAARPNEARLVDWTLAVDDTEAVNGVAHSLQANGFIVEALSGSEMIAPDPWGTRVRVAAQA